MGKLGKAFKGVFKGVGKGVKGLGKGIGKAFSGMGKRNARVKDEDYEHAQKRLDTADLGGTNKANATERGLLRRNAAYAAEQQQLAMNQQQESRATQQAVVNDYTRVIKGQGPSLAQNQLKIGQENAARQALSLAAGGGRGVGQAAGVRQALNVNAQGAQIANQQAAALRAEEVNAARAGMAQAGAQMRQGDLGVADTMGGQFAQNRNTILQRDVAQTTAKQNRDAQTWAQASGQQGFQNERYAQNLGFAGGLIQTAGGIAKASDERVKTNVRSAEGSIGKMLASLEPKEYKYTKESGEDTNKEQVSVMAQDLEKSELGRKFVDERPDGVKVVDYGSMVPTLLANQAFLFSKLSRNKKEKK